LDSIVSGSTSLLTVAIFDDNDNGFMAALSITKNTKCRMQYMMRRPFAEGVLKEMGILPTQAPGVKFPVQHSQ
jgi:hypothetical protein